MKAVQHDNFEKYPTWALNEIPWKMMTVEAFCLVLWHRQIDANNSFMALGEPDVACIIRKHI